MKKRNSKKSIAIEEIISGLSLNEKETLGILVVSDALYDAMLDELNLEDGDEIYRKLLKSMLQRQVKDFIVFTIWNNISDFQLKHFKEFMNQMTVTAPWMELEDVMMEFVLLYPALEIKVLDGLADFFKNFVDRFNKISEA